MANLDGHDIVRVSPCGDIRWRNGGSPHHSLDVDDTDRIWAPIYVPNRRAQGVQEREIFVDSVGVFDGETGEELENIDLLALIREQNLEGILPRYEAILDDVLHLNDVETLDAAMADAFPGLSAGDIMLSIRNHNQIWILDGETRALKWWMTGPMTGQHDPDFQPDGTITVYDNAAAGRSGTLTDGRDLGFHGGSRILRIDPETREITVDYETGPNSTFFSRFRGKHQVLENGNVLVAESDAGRAMEVTPDGTVVWEYINAYDAENVAWMMDAIKYPEAMASVVAGSCS